MTNFSRWELLMRDVTSPQSYIDFGFYFLISAALQRRVWLGDLSAEITGNLYPNIYVILVGDPGVGKGRVINPVNELLKYFRKDLETGKIVKQDEENIGVENYLFPSGPENTTFEQLVMRMAKSYRRVNYKNDKLENKVYGHSSMYFGLEELSSLFQKDTNKITDFLIQTYDCNDYRRETKTQGSDQIKKPCLSFLAGTTPAFMEETFRDRLLSDGMTSRCWFIFELTNRFNLWGTRNLDENQRIAKEELLQHLANIATIYGRCTFSEDANVFLKHWWEEIHPISRPNNNLKLASYYARKNIHVMKLCMILHFSEQVDNFVISRDTAEQALRILNEAEKRMHYALSFGSRNPFYQISGRILKYMIAVKRPVTRKELLDEFYGDLRELELLEVLRDMVSTDKIVHKDGHYAVASLVKGLKFVNESTLSDRKIVGSDLKALPLDNTKKEGTNNI